MFREKDYQNVVMWSSFEYHIVTNTILQSKCYLNIWSKVVNFSFESLFACPRRRVLISYMGHILIMGQKKKHGSALCDQLSPSCAQPEILWDFVCRFLLLLFFCEEFGCHFLTKRHGRYRRCSIEVHLKMPRKRWGKNLWKSRGTSMRTSRRYTHVLRSGPEICSLCSALADQR